MRAILLLPPSSLLVELLLPPGAEAELSELTEPVVSVALLANRLAAISCRRCHISTQITKSIRIYDLFNLVLWGSGFTWVSEVALDGDNFAVAPIINNINAKIKKTSL